MTAGLLCVLHELITELCEMAKWWRSRCVGITIITLADWSMSSLDDDHVMIVHVSLCNRLIILVDFNRRHGLMGVSKDMVKYK